MYFDIKLKVKRKIMFGVVEIANKQYKVEEGSLIKIDYLPSKKVKEEFDAEVLLYKKDDTYKVGFPYVKDCKAILEVVEHRKDKKVIVFKYNSGKHYKRTKGHRQDYTIARLKKIEF